MRRASVFAFIYFIFLGEEIFYFGLFVNSSNYLDSCDLFTVDLIPKGGRHI